MAVLPTGILYTFHGPTLRPARSGVSDCPQKLSPGVSAGPQEESRGDYHGGVNDALPLCPECSSQYAYEMGALLVCPECGHEWGAAAPAEPEESGPRVIKDAVGNMLADGDTVTVVRDLKIKGSSSVIKVGTKVRGIRLMDGVGDHDIDCKVDGVGPMQLKSSVVKKV
jgi:protein PhnA